MLNESEYIAQLTSGVVHQQRMLKKDRALHVWREAVCLKEETTFWQSLAAINIGLAKFFLEELYYHGLHNHQLSEATTSGYPLNYAWVRSIIEQDDPGLGFTD